MQPDPKRHCCKCGRVRRGSESLSQICSITEKLYHPSMQATLTINSRGVVTLPAKLRRAMGLKADDQLIAETTPEGLLLRPAVTLPLEIYSSERVREFDEAEAELAAVLKKPRR